MKNQFLNRVKTHRKGFALLTLVILSMFHFIYGIVPGWNKIQDDFPNYYVSAKLLTEHQDLSVLYSNELFNEKINILGLPTVGQFALYAPPNALLFIPLSGMAPLTAKRAWLLFNVLLIFLCGILIRKLTQWSLVFSIVIVLLSGFALTNDLFLGQVYLFMTTLLMYGLLLIRKNNNYLSGSILGIVLAIKYVSIVFIPSLFLMRKWKALAGIFSAAVFLYLACIPFFGLDTITYFFKHVFYSHINGLLYEGRPYAVQYQSWDSLLNNLFVFDKNFNPNPFIHSMALFYLIKYSLLVSVIFILAWFFLQTFRQPLFLDVTVSLSLLSLLILEPGSATYHLLFLLLPFIMILRLMILSKSPLQPVYVILFFLIGFLPALLNTYTVFNGNNLSHGDIRFLFSYHRLWLEMVFYFCSIYFLFNFVKNDSFQNAKSITKMKS